jgi:hypothetical protein
MSLFKLRNSNGTLKRVFMEDELKKAQKTIYSKIKKGDLKPKFDEDETDPLLQKFDPGRFFTNCFLVGVDWFEELVININTSPQVLAIEQKYEDLKAKYDTLILGKHSSYFF